MGCGISMVPAYMLSAAWFQFIISHPNSWLSMWLGNPVYLAHQFFIRSTAGGLVFGLHIYRLTNIQASKPFI